MTIKRIILICSLIACLTSTGLGLLVALNEQHLNLQKRVESYVSSGIKDIQAANILVPSPTSFELHMETYTSNHPKVQLYVVDKAGIIKSSTDSASAGKRVSQMAWSHQITDILNSNITHNVITVYDKGQSAYFGIAPLCNSEDCPTLVYGYDLSSEFFYPLLHSKQVLIQLSIFLVFLLFLIVVVKRRLDNRLGGFADVFSDWHKGNRDQRVITESSDEFLPLANSVNFLISELQEEQRALIESREFNKAIIESAKYTIISTDVSGVIKTINSAGCELTKYTSDELVGHHTPLLFLPTDCHNDTALATLSSLHIILPSDQDEALSFIEEETFFITKEAKRIPVQVSLTPMKNSAGLHSGYLCIAADISEAKRAEKQLRLAASVYSHSNQAIIILGADQHIIDANSRFKELINTDTPLCKLTPQSTLSPRHSPAFFSHIWNQTIRSGHWSGEVWQTNKSGQEFPSLVTMHCINSPQGDIESVLMLSQDITEKKLAEQKLERMAYLDSLTGLPNRFLYRDRLELAMEQSRHHNHQVALMFIDLNRFKEVNDNFGHEVGDELLVVVANRLQSAINKGDTLSRLGGDEFTVILPNLDPITSRHATAKAARKLLSVFEKPFQLSHHSLFVNGSIGIAIYPRDGADFSELCRNADTAMYKAKESEESHYTFFDSEMTQDNLRRVNIENQLREEISNDTVTTHFQPIIDCKHRAIAGFEALCRCSHPEYPDAHIGEFIIVAEEVGLIQELGQKVLENSCKLLTTLISEYPDIFVTVNVSPQQFKASDFSYEFLNTLEAYSVSTKNIKIEITESTLLQEDSAAFNQIQNLSKAGVRIMIDDFGTGYSSLNYLRKYPIANIKIDKSFVFHARDNHLDKTIIRAVKMIADEMDIAMVAEGVEDQQDLDMVINEGIKYAQGFLFSKAISPEDVPAYLKDFDKF